LTPGDIEIVLLRPDEVMVDKESLTQRDLRIPHARAIAKEYNPALFGLGHVSLRPDGHYYALDGQHRCAAAIMAGRGHDRVPFQVWRGLSIREEAKKFEELNKNRLKVDAISRFRVGVTARNPVNVAIVRILESFSLTYGLGAAEGTVNAVEALIQIFECRIRGIKLPAKPERQAKVELPKGHLLSRTLQILTQAWGRDRNAFDGVLMKGVAALIWKHDVRVEGSRLAKLLAKHETPTRSVGKIRTLSDTARVSTVVAAVQYLEGVYNRNLTEDNKLQ
jgi:hypothetical protein